MAYEYTSKSSINPHNTVVGDTLCCFDTELMPKLQHVRLAGKFFLDYEIPHEFTHLWRYIKEMYQLDAFGQSCPADQDIIQGRCDLHTEIRLVTHLHLVQ